MQKSIAGWGFVFAGLVFLVVGAIPVFSGHPAKLTYIVLAMAFLVIGAGVARRRRQGPPAP